MAGMSVEDLKNQVLPGGSSVVAGSVGLDREVTWPVTMRTRPPAFPHLKGGEITLISIEAMHLLDQRLQLVTVVRSLAGQSISAVAVVGEVPNDASELADSIGLPILILPTGIHLPDLEQSIARAIVEHRTNMHQRSQDIYRRLTEIAIEGRGLDSILEMLAELTSKEVVLEDQNFQVRSCVTLEAGGCSPAVVAMLKDDADRLTAWLDRTHVSASDPPILRLSVGETLSRIVAPIAVKDVVLGYLSVVGRRGTLSEIDELAARRGASACAIELARERAVLEAEDRLQTDLVEALVTGTFVSSESIVTRAHRLGFDLKGAFSAIVFAAVEHESTGLRSPRATLWSRRLRTALEQEIVHLGVRAPIGSRGDRIVLLVPPPSSDPAPTKSLAETLRAHLSTELETPVSVGVGRPHAGVEGIRQSYQEAEGALTLGGKILGMGQVACFADLGLYRLLLALHSTAELEEFFISTLGMLSDYDRKNDGELVKTLDAYFACLGSPTEAAERLHVHRNTLLYRLHRIQEIAHVDLSDAETRLALHLSLRVREVLRAGGRLESTGQSAQKAAR